MSSHSAALHQAEAINAFMSGALTNPHQPAKPTPEQARKVLPWLERETDHPILWDAREYKPGRVQFIGVIRHEDPVERRTAIEAWAAVIGSWSITDNDGVLAAIGMYQGFPVELTAMS
ncbi:hypothetical protein ABZ635_26005 [Nocardiopsis sp. NPDC007018]|uniref:hypothetical protein n=1 Tax=Nocardiopsis sp. NPDC007018 TaxID=3155721 RepID=UPI0033DCB43C